MQAKVVETNAFEIFKHNENAVTYGAFGCCGLIIQDNTTKDYLLAHIAQESILSKPIADRTVETMLQAWKEAGYDINEAKVEIIHNNKIKDIFPNTKLEDLDKRFSYAFKRGKFAMGIPANEFLEQAFKRKEINPKINNKFNGNVVAFLTKSYNGVLSQDQSDKMIKTNIAIIDGNLYLQNIRTNPKPEVFMEGEKELFERIENVRGEKYEVKFTKEMADGLKPEVLPPFGTMINPFDAVGLHIKTILKNNPEKTLNTLDEKDVKVLLQDSFKIHRQFNIEKQIT